MQNTDVLTVSDEVVSREVGGEMVLLNLSSGLYFGLDAVGGRIWALLCEGPHSLSQLCDVIEDEFDAPRDQIEKDVGALAVALCEQDLIAAKAA